jgi:hypothetical protein
MACSEAQTRIGMAARKDGAKARELIGMPLGQVVGRMTEEVSSADVIYQFIDEFVESVERLQRASTLPSKAGLLASNQSRDSLGMRLRPLPV